METLSGKKVADPRPSKDVEAIRDEIANIRSRLTACGFTNPSWSDQLKNVEGLLNCGLVTLFSTKNEMAKHEVETDDINRGTSLGFRSRGIGTDTCSGCFVCGSKSAGVPHLASTWHMSNISAFVESKADGETIVSWFDKGARLDYREYEPNWIQVKVGACENHLAQLQKLHKLVRPYGLIRKADIADAMAFTPTPVPDTLQQEAVVWTDDQKQALAKALDGIVSQLPDVPTERKLAYLMQVESEKSAKKP